MDIIEMTRELGKAIQQDERYVAYTLAKTANDNDAELQTLINDFDKKRTSLNEELSKEDKNTDMIKALDEDIKDVYSRIMSNQNMMIFNGAKNALEQLISEVNQIVTLILVRLAMDAAEAVQPAAAVTDKIKAALYYSNGQPVYRLSV